MGSTTVPIGVDVPTRHHSRTRRRYPERCSCGSDGPRRSVDDESLKLGPQGGAGRFGSGSHAGIARIKNSSNSGTVNAVSPWAGL